MKLEEVSIPGLEALVQTTLSNKRCRHVLKCPGDGGEAGQAVWGRCPPV